MRSEPAHARRHPARRRLPMLLALVLGGAMLASACGRESSGTDAAAGTAGAAADPAPAEEEARIVRVVRPEPGELVANRSASARVRALQDATVASGASARVEEVLARPGDTVAAGALIVRLDDTQAALQLESARLAVRQAEIDLERARRGAGEGEEQARAALQAAERNAANLRSRVAEVRALVEVGGAARADLDALEAQLAQAEASRIQAQDALARAERSEVEELALLELSLSRARVQVRQVEDALAQTRIRAPFAGEIVESYLEAGEFAGAGQPAFRLQSSGRSEAVFDVPPEDAAGLMERGEVTLRYAGRDVPATLVGSARPAQQPRLVQLVARIDGEEARRIPNGALAEVRYAVKLAEGLLLPAGAIASEAGETWLYLVRDGRAERVPVAVLAEAGGTAVVAGVSGGEAVIHPRPLDVRIGTRVRAEP